MERQKFFDTDCLTARGRSERPTVLREDVDCQTNGGSSENPFVNKVTQLGLGQAALAIQMILNDASL